MTLDRDKRIILLVPEFPKTSETFIVSKFMGLLRRGWDVHLVCYKSDPRDWTKFPALDENPKIRQHFHRSWPLKPQWLAGALMLPALIRGLFCAPVKSWTYLVKGFKEFGWSVFQKYYLDLEMICLRPDILHVEFGAFAVGRTYLKNLLNCKLSVSFRGYDLNFAGLDQPNYYAQVWQQADACHFLGEDLWKRALRRGCPEHMPHRLIPPAIDLRQFHSEKEYRSDVAGTPDNPIKILSVGRLEWKKGYEFALQAVRNLVDQDITVVYLIIGEGEHSDALHFARHQLGLEETVEFIGSLPQEEVIRHLEETDIFLHPSLSEGFCNAVLEAQAMGIPVVCTDAGGLPENVADGVSGFVVPRRDPHAMAEKLRLLTQDFSLRQSMGKAGRKRIETNFQLEQQLEDFESFYDLVFCEKHKKAQDS